MSSNTPGIGGEPPPPPPPPPMQYGRPTPVAATIDLPHIPRTPWGADYADIWPRVGGYLLDGLIVAIPYFILAVIIGSATANSTTINSGADVASLVLDLLIFVGSAGYFTYFWSTTGATIGQKAVGIKVVDATTGGPLTPGRGLIRWLGYMVSIACFYLGFFWAIWDDKRQTWADKMANTVVVRA